MLVALGIGAVLGAGAGSTAFDLGIAGRAGISLIGSILLTSVLGCGVDIIRLLPVLVIAYVVYGFLGSDPRSIALALATVLYILMRMVLGDDAGVGCQGVPQAVYVGLPLPSLSIF